MALTPTPVFKKAVTGPLGNHFLTVFSGLVAGASGNTIKLPAARVKSVVISGRSDADVGFSFARPTLTLTNLVSGKTYDIWVLWQ